MKMSMHCKLRQQKLCSLILWLPAAIIMRVMEHSMYITCAHYLPLYWSSRIMIAVCVDFQATLTGYPCRSIHWNGMRLGHGPGGATGLAINKRQMTVWALLSFATCGELVPSFHALIAGANNIINLSQGGVIHTNRCRSTGHEQPQESLITMITYRLHTGRHQLKAQCPLSIPWRMVGSTTDPTWSPRLCQRSPCLPQLLSWRWNDVGAHLVVKEDTVNVAAFVVLFNVHAREVRCAWKCSQRSSKN